MTLARPPRPRPSPAARHGAVLALDRAARPGARRGPAPTNVRPEPTAFFGRAADLAALHALLTGAAQLVTLTGVAGVGKTRAAREYALQNLAHFPAGAWFCDLSDARDPERAASTIGRTLGLPAAFAPDAGGDVAAQLGEALAARGPLLLVLDNLEQLLPAAAPLVETLRACAPVARLLVTSQEPLRLPAEFVYELAPLAVPEARADDDDAGASSASCPPSPADLTAPLREDEAPDAVRLFVDRARHVRRDFAPTAADRRVLGAIARGLDGIPLALELAAARLSLLGPAALEQMLARRFELLVSRGAGAGGNRRHATLRGAIDWSWDLLAPPERAALAQCSVFHGGFTVAAAERVLAPDPSHPDPAVLEVLQALRDKSLLTSAEAAPAQPGQTTRLACLSSIREYAAERLAQDPAARDAALARHAEHYLDAATAAARAGAPLALAADRDNVFAALEWALPRAAGDAARWARATGALLAFGRVAYAHGPLGAYAALLRAAVASAPPEAPALAGQALAALAEYHWFVGELDAAIDAARAGLGRAEAAGDAGLAGALRNLLGLTLLSAGRFEQSGEELSRALAQHRAAGDRRREAAALRALAQHDLLQGRLRSATARFEQAQEIFRALADALEQARVLVGLAWIAAERGQHEAALSRAGEALALAGPDAAFGGWVLALRSEIAADRGEYDAALGHCAASLETARQVAHRRQEASLRGYRGMILLQAGRTDAAREELAWAGRVASEPRFRALFLGFLAGAEALAGQLDAADARLGEAERALAGTRDTLAAAVQVLRALLELCRAAQLATAPAAAAAPAAELDALRAAARARIEAAVRDPVGDAPPAAQMYEVRAALRVLARAHGAAALPPAARALVAAGEGARTSSPSSSSSASDALRLARDGAWFALPGGAPVACERRKVLRRLLVALGEQRTRAPGVPLSPEALIAAGWPGERMLPAAARNRLKFSLALLRRLGLRAPLRSVPRGYLLDPALPLEWVDAL